MSSRRTRSRSWTRASRRALAHGGGHDRQPDCRVGGWARLRQVVRRGGEDQEEEAGGQGEVRMQFLQTLLEKKCTRWQSIQDVSPQNVGGPGEGVKIESGPNTSRH